MEYTEEDKQKVDKLMSDYKKRCLSDISIKLNIHPRKVKKICDDLGYK